MNRGDWWLILGRQYRPFGLEWLRNDMWDAKGNQLFHHLTDMVHYGH